MSSVRLHPKYGVNPTIPTCFWCGKDKNEIALLGAAYKEEAPMHMQGEINGRRHVAAAIEAAAGKAFIQRKDTEAEVLRRLAGEVDREIKKRVEEQNGVLVESLSRIRHAEEVERKKKPRKKRRKVRRRRLL